MRRARRPAVERLSGGEELIADAAAVVIGLRDAGLDVRAGRDDVGFDSTVAARRIDGAAAREADDVIGAVGAGVADAAAVVPGLAEVLARAYRNYVLGRAGAADGVCARSVVAGREDHYHLLIAGDAALRVAHYAVNFLRVGVVAEKIDEAPGVARTAGALAASRFLPDCRA